MSFLMRVSPLVNKAGASLCFQNSLRSSTVSAISQQPKSLAFSSISTRNAQNNQNMSSAGQAISEKAKAEGGPTAGSTSAQMQSQVGKEQNFDQAAQEVGSKMANNPGSVTAEDANYLKSREARATGQAQPGKESISAEAQRLASANEQGTSTTSAPSTNATSTSTTGTGPLSSDEQSQLTKQKNFEEAASAMSDKMINDPESVTKRDADLMHRREQRAQGHTEKGGLAAQAQQQAAENEK